MPCDLSFTLTQFEICTSAIFSLALQNTVFMQFLNFIVGNYIERYWKLSHRSMCLIHQPLWWSLLLRSFQEDLYSPIKVFKRHLQNKFQKILRKRLVNEANWEQMFISLELSETDPNSQVTVTELDETLDFLSDFALANIQHFNFYRSVLYKSWVSYCFARTPLHARILLQCLCMANTPPHTQTNSLSNLSTGSRWKGITC